MAAILDFYLFPGWHDFLANAPGLLCLHVFFWNTWTSVPDVWERLLNSLTHSYNSTLFNNNNMMVKTIAINSKTPAGRFNMKTSSYLYRRSHCGYKTILRQSYLRNGIPYPLRRQYGRKIVLSPQWDLLNIRATVGANSAVVESNDTSKMASLYWYRAHRYRWWNLLWMRR